MRPLRHREHAGGLLMKTTIAVAGTGTIGGAVCQALIDGIEGFSLTAAADLDPQAAARQIDRPHHDLPFVALNELADYADWIVEALPAKEAPVLARQVLEKGKTLVMISSAALLLHPELKDMAGQNGGRLLIPSGAIAGLDGINALAENGIKSARLLTTKPPQAYANAPYITQQKINLAAIKTSQTLFTGHARDAAAAFPANINVAATLTLASRLAPENVEVEIRADPAAPANSHEIFVESTRSAMHFAVKNMPDPANPKTSALAAQSIIALLRRQNTFLQVG